MKRFIPLIIVILILVGVGIGVLCYQRQKAVKECKQECEYITSERKGSFILDTDYLEPAYWEYKGKKLETQDQCIDWCLTVK